MLGQVLQALAVKRGGVYVDGTLGGGGHAEAILAGSSPTGWLYGCDRDGDAVEAAARRLVEFAGRFELKQGSFAELSKWVPAGSCDGVLLDLGVSSPQLERAERGFSFQQEGPLDMRMDRRQSVTAADLVNTSSMEELAAIFWQFGGEPNARRVARAIVHDRQHKQFSTTRDLAGLIERIIRRDGKKTHPATKIFQALRIAVNDELGSLRLGLEGVVGLLKSSGRFAVITFHSLEDRLVKDFGRRFARDYDIPGEVDVPELRQPCTPKLKIITKKALHPTEAEMLDNPRSRSAQLRVMEKT
jgi:16S rRNA (cytosine1402-N4)-methyltransferase